VLEDIIAKFEHATAPGSIITAMTKNPPRNERRLFLLALDNVA
jgi:hypothetical protein